MQTAMKAIETRYKGYRFRSRLEARWAVFFDALNVKWEYEKEGYDLDGVLYLPDFWLPEFSCWIEVKGKMDETSWEKIQALRSATGKPVYVFESIPSVGETVHHLSIHDSEVQPKLKLTNGEFSVYKFLNGENCSYLGQEVICPVLECNCVNVHIGEAISDPDGGRGNQGQAGVKMDCEFGHEWKLSIHGHKGTVGIDIEDVFEIVSDFTLILSKLDKSKREHALSIARSARFEHGETP